MSWRKWRTFNRLAMNTNVHFANDRAVEAARILRGRRFLEARSLAAQRRAVRESGSRQSMEIWEYSVTSESQWRLPRLRNLHVGEATCTASALEQRHTEQPDVDD